MAMSAPGAFVAKEPFSKWADEFDKASRDLDKRLQAHLQEVVGTVATAVKEAIRNDPTWPDGAEDTVDVVVQKGKLTLVVKHPEAMDAEYGTPEQGPAPAVRTTAAQAQANLNRKLSDAVKRATGIR